MKPKVGGLDVIHHLKPALLLGIVGLVAVLAAVAIFWVVRGRSAAGPVGRAQTAAGAACLAFSLLGLQLHLLAATAMPAVNLILRTDRIPMPRGARLLALLAEPGNLPTYQGSFALACVLAGLGCWLAARSEAVRREEGLAAVRRIVVLMSIGAVCLLLVSGVSIASLWKLIPEAGGRGA